MRFFNFLNHMQTKHRTLSTLFFLTLGAVIGQLLKKEPKWIEIPFIVLFCSAIMIPIQWAINRIFRKKDLTCDSCKCIISSEVIDDPGQGRPKNGRKP